MIDRWASFVDSSNQEIIAGTVEFLGHAKGSAINPLLFERDWKQAKRDFERLVKSEERIPPARLSVMQRLAQLRQDVDEYIANTDTANERASAADALRSYYQNVQDFQEQQEDRRMERLGAERRSREQAADVAAGQIQPSPPAHRRSKN